MCIPQQDSVIMEQPERVKLMLFDKKIKKYHEECLVFSLGYCAIKISIVQLIYNEYINIKLQYFLRLFF
jgi:hypothetical protein